MGGTFLQKGVKVKVKQKLTEKLSEKGKKTKSEQEINDTEKFPRLKTIFKFSFNFHFIFHVTSFAISNVKISKIAI
jgi:hypothetical protein